MAMGHGLDILKFFPAEALGGIKTLKAIGGPYTQMRFIPTGGIGPKNLADYLSLPMVFACGGSWLASKALIANGEFEKITELTQEAMQMVKQIRDK